MMQLRNLINRRNIGHDVSGCFNASVDFFELVTRCHILAAALSFFGMADLDSEPSCNSLPDGISKWQKTRQWDFYSSLIGRMVDRYIVVRDFLSVVDSSGHALCLPLESTSAFAENPHCKRIAGEHSYCSSKVASSHTESRSLPRRLEQQAGQAQHVLLAAQDDGVFSYACAVLTDGLLLLELRDAIHQGDGPRILRCWKFMLLYFKRYNHHKYALEAFRLLAYVNGVASPLAAQQITWSRTISSRGGHGKNVPADLHNEHVNRSLKDCVLGLGANVTEEGIVHISKAMQHLNTICHNADTALGIPPASVHHTTQSSEKDAKLILDELMKKSLVFDYVPGRSHSLPNVQPCIAKAIDANKLIEWITHQKKRLKADFEFSSYLE